MFVRIFGCGLAELRFGATAWMNCVKMMDLTKLVERLQHPNPNAVSSFEAGQIVRRTHAHVYKDVKGAEALLRAFGVGPGMRVGIRAPNCYQWIIYDLALIELRAVSVAFSDDFAGKAASELLQEYDLSLLLVPTSEYADSCHCSSAIACIDGPNLDVKVRPSKPDGHDPDFARIGMVFSSGSSGRCKGLLLNRRGIETNIDAFTLAVKPRQEDCLLLFLPISNFQQRMMYYAALWYGFDLIIADSGKLFRALKELHPTILIAPPMLYENLETRFCNLPPFKQRFAKAVGAVIGKLPLGFIGRRLARAVFREAYEAFGGRMRFMVTGMAPIRRSTLELFQLMQLPLFETYGLTEFGNIALNLPGACRIGSVGKLLSGVQVEFAPDGEIIAAREHSIATGYFEGGEGCEEETFLPANRIATGDIGRLEQNGYLYIIGRKKEVIVTTGGMKIHPEILESEIQACSDVARAVIFQDSAQDILVAVVLLRHSGDDARHRVEQFIAHLEERPGNAVINSVIFTDIVFSRENGFLLPNLKLNRRKIAASFSSSPHSEPELNFASRSA